DWRKGKPAILTDDIEPRLKRWTELPPLPDEPVRALRRAERLKIGFGVGREWDEEKVLERYELLYEAGLVAEAKRDGRPAAAQWSDLPELGRAMAFDHRRILATAMGRLRGKLKYRPVVFELLPPEFTLYDLQKTVEAISGTLLHKQNFRRLVEKGGLVEATGNVSTETCGREAARGHAPRDGRAAGASLPLPPGSGARAPCSGFTGQGRPRSGLTRHMDGRDISEEPLSMPSVLRTLAAMRRSLLPNQGNQFE